MISGEGYLSVYSGEGVTFSVFMRAGEAVTMHDFDEPRSMYYMVVRVYFDSELSTTSPDNSSSSDNRSSSDNSSSSDDGSNADGDNSVSTAPVVSDVKASGEEISVAGVKVKTSVAGVYAAKKV